MKITAQKTNGNATAGHTPGPWTAEINETGRPPMHSDWRVYCEGSTPCRIKPIARLELRGQESEANARLIASAPDMLEALHKISRLAGVSAERAIAEEAIARATS